MNQIEDVIVSSITELIRVFIILEYLKTFLEIRSVKCNVFNSIITYAVTLFSYLVFHNVLINLFVTIVGIVFLSTGFVGQLKKKLLLSIMVYGIMFVIDLLASFLLYEAPDSNNYDIVSSFISLIFFYIVVIGIKKIFKENGKIDLSGQWYLLLFSALLSIAVLYIVYMNMAVSREAVITISSRCGYSLIHNSDSTNHRLFTLICNHTILVSVSAVFAYLIDNVHTVCDSSESCVLSIKAWSVLLHNEKLGTCRIICRRARHRNSASYMAYIILYAI